MKIRRAVAIATLLAGTALAQEFPVRPITIIVPFPPGGATDPFARAVAQKLSENMKQSVLVESKAGGAGIPAAMHVKQAPPDGYTLLMGHSGTHAVNPSLYAKLPYDAIRDFQPISLMLKSTFLLVVPPDSPAKSVTELIAFAKSRAGGIGFASQGIGTGGHLLGEMLKARTGAPLTHIPYKGAGPAVTDLLASRVEMYFDSPLLSGRFVKDGKLRALAVTSLKRNGPFPDVPTMTEAGYPGLELETWFGIVGPAGMPQPVVRKLHAELEKALASPDLVKRFTDQGLDVLTSTPEEFGRLIDSDIGRLGKVVTAAGVRAD